MFVWLFSFLEHATSSSLPSEDWGLNMEICDIVNETAEGCVCCLFMWSWQWSLTQCIWTPKLQLKLLKVIVFDQSFLLVKSLYLTIFTLSPPEILRWYFNNLTTFTVLLMLTWQAAKQIFHFRKCFNLIELALIYYIYKLYMIYIIIELYKLII